MKHRYFALLLVAFIALCVAALYAPSYAAPLSQPGPTLPQDHVADDVCGGLQTPNLLQNPSFEGSYSAYIPPGGHDDCPHGVCNTAQMADGWTPYWRSHNPADPAEIIRMPEYKPAEVGLDPPRTHQGQRAQQLFTFSSTHEAGFYQRVTVIPGALYCFGIWGHAWSSSDDNPFTWDSELEQAIGVDPTGGTNWQSPDIIWGGPRQYYYDLGEDNGYGPFSLVVRAQTSQLTVFTWSRPIWPVKHNDVYWDDAVLLRPSQEPVLEVAHNEISLVEPVAASGTYTISVDISFTQDPGMIWRASLQDGNSLDVNLAPVVADGAAGTAFSDLVITFDSAAYGPGTYSAAILVEADPAVSGSPQIVEVNLNIFEEIHRYALPLFTR